MNQLEIWYAIANSALNFIFISIISQNGRRGVGYMANAMVKMDGIALSAEASFLGIMTITVWTTLIS